MSGAALWQRLVSGVAGLVAVGALFGTFARRDYPIGLLPALLAVAAAVLVHVPRLGPQLVARAVWWSAFALGVLIAVVGSRHERSYGFAMATASALALVAIGSRSLAEAGERDAFAPVAFRTTFLLLMMLTLADAQTLALFGVATLLDDTHPTQSLVFLGGAAGLVVAFVGLYRVTLWGALLSVATSAIVALFVPFIGDEKRELVVFIWLLCALEILVAAPMVLAVLARRRLPEPPLALRTWGSRLILAALWLGSAVSTFAP